MAKERITTTDGKQFTYTTGGDGFDELRGLFDQMHFVKPSRRRLPEVDGMDQPGDPAGDSIGNYGQAL